LKFQAKFPKSEIPKHWSGIGIYLVYWLHNLRTSGLVCLLKKRVFDVLDQHKYSRSYFCQRNPDISVPISFPTLKVWRSGRIIGLIKKNRRIIIFKTILRKNIKLKNF